MTRDERGAVMVEAAFAVPIVILAVLSMFDLGRWGLANNQATNAARDGSRMAQLHFVSADVSGSSDHAAVVEAIGRNMPHTEITASDVTVTCIDSDGVVITGGCANAERGVDRIRVEFDWEFDIVNPLAAVVDLERAEVTASSSTLIVGLPIADDGFLATTTSTSAPPP